ncbi:MAG TPA: monovalent cation:proton antiporter-2 (CPA2) family protein [Gammaproteobacteria bacterium]
MLEAQTTDLSLAVSLLGSGIVAVALFKRLGLGSVLGYLAAGLAIGPFGLKLVTHPEAILHVAELGVVMFLFIVGLEMRPAKLWSLRKDIFGVGVGQVALSGAALTGVGAALGMSPPVAFVAAMGFVLSSTAIVMQILEERGVVATPKGQRIVSILLLEDLTIVPLLAGVALMAPVPSASAGPRWLDVATALGAIAGLLTAGLWLLNPLFRLLADARAREVMTAAALLVVLGAALLMELGGLSMAMGAFLAGVLLSESSFRHQLEADIEPFRGILLGLFFLGVGMSLDLAVVARDWQRILLLVVAFMTVKGIATYALARLTGAANRESWYRAVLLSEGGEFAFVLYAAAANEGLFAADVSARLTAAVIISMSLMPLATVVLRRLLPPAAESLEGVEEADGLRAHVLIIGFGRFGQVVSQALLARGFEVAIIDTDTEMIQAAARFGFKIYYGDGTRLDVLRASGAENARAIAVCVDDGATASRIVELVKESFPHAKLLVRAKDRVHALELTRLHVDYQIRETFESALAFGAAALRVLGVSAEEAAEIAEDVRTRDRERFAVELASGDVLGAAKLLRVKPEPQPFHKPRTQAEPLNEDARAVLTAPADTADTRDAGERAAP